jgi:hypothetical protein
MFLFLWEMGNLYRLIRKIDDALCLADNLNIGVLVSEFNSFTFSTESKYFLSLSELESRIKKRISKEGDYGYEILKGISEVSSKAPAGKYFSCFLKIYSIELHGYFPQELPLVKTSALSDELLYEPLGDFLRKRKTG